MLEVFDKEKRTLKVIFVFKFRVRRAPYRRISNSHQKHISPLFWMQWFNPLCCLGEDFIIRSSNQKFRLRSLVDMIMDENFRCNINMRAFFYNNHDYCLSKRLTLNALIRSPISTAIYITPISISMITTDLANGATA